MVKPLKLNPQRKHKDGRSAARISVLAVERWVGNTQNGMIYLRHDSCTDISLISAEYYKSLKNLPPIKQGLKLKLWQLTDKDAKIEGYVKLPIFTETETNKVVETEVEAYVVPGMSVPILLGEDYQMNYEVNICRNVTEGCYITYGEQNDLRVRMVLVNKTEEFKRLRASAHCLQSFVKAKNHRRQKNKWLRKK